jgi:hypothetical protein
MTGDNDQVARRFDRLVQRLLKTPPKSRAEVAEAARRAKGKARSQGRPAKARKPA